MPLEAALQPGQILRMDAGEPGVGRRRDLLLLEAEHRLPAIRIVDAVAVEVPVPDAVVGPANRERVALLALAQRLLRLASFADVLADGNDSHRFVLVVEDQVEEDLDREVRPVLPKASALAAQAPHSGEVAEVEIVELRRQKARERLSGEAVALGAVHVGQRRIRPPHDEIAVGDRNSGLCGLERLLELAQAFARLPELREVADQHQDAALASGERRDPHDADREGRTVLAVGLERTQASGIAAVGRAGFRQEVTGLEGEEELQLLVPELGEGVAPERLDPGARPQDRALGVGHDSGVVERFEDLLRQVGEVTHHRGARYHRVSAAGDELLRLRVESPWPRWRL